MRKLPIGLEQHSVVLLQHQPEWIHLCATEVEALRKGLGDSVVDIQHVGSTAVPGLLAKPILDIAVAVEKVDDILAVVNQLTENGYLDRGDAGRDGGYLLVKECEPGVRTIHLHIVTESDDQWRNYIWFRDILCKDASVRESYAALKENLAKRYPDDRKSYTASKNDFIQSVLKRKND